MKMCETSSGLTSFVKLNRIRFFLRFIVMVHFFVSVQSKKILPCKFKSGFYNIKVLKGEFRQVTINEPKSVFLDIKHGVTEERLKIAEIKDESQYDHECCKRLNRNTGADTNPWSPLQISLNRGEVESTNSSDYVWISISHSLFVRLDAYDENKNLMQSNNIQRNNQSIYYMNLKQKTFGNDSPENGENFQELKNRMMILNVWVKNNVLIRPVPLVATSFKINHSPNNSLVQIQNKDVDSLLNSFKSFIRKENFMITCACISGNPSSYLHLTMVIAEPPIPSYEFGENYETNYTMSPDVLNEVSGSIVNMLQTSSLWKETGLSIPKLMLLNSWQFRKLENNSMCLINKWNKNARQIDMLFEKPVSLKLCMMVENIYINTYIEEEINLVLLNDENDPIKLIGSSSNDLEWKVKISLDGSETAALEGKTISKFENGLASISNISVNETGKNFRLKFEVFVENRNETIHYLNITTYSNMFDVNVKPLVLKVSNIPYKTKEGEVFSPSPKVEILQSSRQNSASPELLHKYQWNVVVYLLDEEYFNGSQLMGTKSKYLPDDSNYLHFTDLHLTKFGYRYRLGFECTSIPPQYKLTSVLGPFDVERDVLEPRQIEETWRIQITFSGNYASILPYKSAFSTYFLNSFGFKYYEVLWGNVTISPGSVIVNTTISGTISELQTTTANIQTEISEGSSANFNGTTMSISSIETSSPPVISGNDNQYSEIDPGVNQSEDDEIPSAWVVAIVLNVILGIIFIIVIIYWYKKHKNTQRNRLYNEETKIFEKSIKSDGNLENKAAGGNMGLKQQHVYSIKVDEASNHDDNKSRSYSAKSDGRRSSSREEEDDQLDGLSYPQMNSDDEYQYNSLRNNSRNESRNSNHSRQDFMESRLDSDRSRRDSIQSRLSSIKSVGSRTGSGRSRSISAHSHSRSDPDLRSSTTKEEYLDNRSNSAERRNSLRSSSRHSNAVGVYDYDNNDDLNREKYLVYEITGDTTRSRDYLAYIMLPEESPPTLIETRDYFKRSGVMPALQEISNLNYIYVRESGKQISQALENSTLVCDIFPNREILIRIQPKGFQKNNKKNNSHGGFKNFLKNNIVSNTVKQIHKNSIGVRCQNQDCEKEAILKCVSCGKAPYCSKKCMTQDLRYHSVVCYKPPWKT